MLAHFVSFLITTSIRDEFDIKDVRDRSVKFPIQNQAQSERSGHTLGGSMQSWCLTLKDEAEQIIFKAAYSHASRHNVSVENAEVSTNSSSKGKEDGGNISDDASKDSETTDAGDEHIQGRATGAAATINNDSTDASVNEDGSRSNDESATGVDDSEDSDELVSLPETQDVFSLNRRFA